MREAIALAYLGPRSPNPRVGCVIVDAHGTVVGAGYHHGAGTAHAEIEALQSAGTSARGATAVVTLEPCMHAGRTGPCTTALLDAGIARVVYAQADPTPEASGGADVLRSAGVEVVAGVEGEAAAAINTAWTHVQLEGRPRVIVKLAHSLDARVAEHVGGPTSISGVPARGLTHELRAQSDAVMVGTGTAIADDPQLTVREISVDRQPLRVVMGERALPAGLRIFDDQAPHLLIREREPRTALSILLAQGVQQVLIEGGPTLVTAFLEAGCVDEVVWFLAPLLLGAGVPTTRPMSLAIPVDVRDVNLIGDDVMVRGRIARRDDGQG